VHAEGNVQKVVGGNQKYERKRETITKHCGQKNFQRKRRIADKKVVRLMGTKEDF